MIPHNRPLVLDDDISAVGNTMASGWIAQGPSVQALESDFCGYHGGGDAAACSSGSAALFLSLEAFGIGKDHAVAVPSYACSALLNAVNLAGATPVICDVLEDSFCIDPANMPKVDAAIAVHTFGAEADIDGIQKMARLVIEDCCQSLGGMRDDTPLGTKGDAAVFSFYATKIITCGNGGLVWSSNQGTIDRIKDYREFDCRESYRPRFNFLLSDIQAAMARSQFARLGEIAERRRATAAKYLDAIKSKIRVQTGLDAPGRMAYRFVLRFEEAAHRESMEELLASNGIQTAVPIEHWELLHRYLHLDAERFPHTEKLAKTTLSLPIHPGLSDSDTDHIATVLQKALS